MKTYIINYKLAGQANTLEVQASSFAQAFNKLLASLLPSVEVSYLHILSIEQRG